MKHINGWYGNDKFNYVEACSMAVNDDNVYHFFKQNPLYTPILEHVHGELALAYYNILMPEYRELIPLAGKINDSVGGPLLTNTPSGMVSGTTLRYLKVLQELDALGFLGGDIIEIGAGYGGQARIILKLAKNRESINSYTSVDLPSPSLLQAKYNSDITKFSSISFDSLKTLYSEVIISNYSFSELASSTQEVYLEKVILNAKHGYITYNPGAGVELSYQELFQKLKNKQIKTMPDFPMQNFRGERHLVITW